VKGKRRKSGVYPRARRTAVSVLAFIYLRPDCEINFNHSGARDVWTIASVLSNAFSIN
jgi:hypothetical protein